ncbi:hypothetical protein HK097_005240 [Rhizophlyctis rosea]|uniref:Uncharacterized protein n=1 Tax=Rhizophlyctis rosea TaxID=64517 RepID=A0AAD5SFD4_9FUNG|nr:hypothetical protein HK097_005240 [Rhizophlyctis rosea]
MRREVMKAMMPRQPFPDVPCRLTTILGEEEKPVLEVGWERMPSGVFVVVREYREEAASKELGRRAGVTVKIYFRQSMAVEGAPVLVQE